MIVATNAASVAAGADCSHIVMDVRVGAAGGGGDSGNGCAGTGIYVLDGEL